MTKIILTVTNAIIYDQRMQRICNTLVANGYEVMLVGRTTPTVQEITNSYSFKTHLIKCKYQKGKLFYAEYNYKLFRFLRSQEANIFCAIDLDTLLPCFLAAKNKKIPLIFDAHEYFQEVPELVNRPLEKNIWAFLAAVLIPRVNKAYTVSSSLAEIFTSKYGIDFQVVRNTPAYSSPQKMSREEGKPFILYQGVLNEGRGLRELFLAIVDLDVDLKIAGEGDLSNEVRTWIKELQIENKVSLLGYVNPAELKMITPKAWLGYNLLENKGLSYYYSLANKFFDYTMAGIPCLVSPFPEYLALNEKYHHAIVCSLNVEEIKQSIKYWLSHPKEYAALVENCYKAAKELCWERDSEVLLEVYREM